MTSLINELIDCPNLMKIKDEATHEIYERTNQDDHFVVRDGYALKSDDISTNNSIFNSESDNIKIQLLTQSNLIELEMYNTFCLRLEEFTCL
jgi:hypothetical protein